MNEDLNPFYECLSYKEGFGLSEVNPFMQRNWLIDTCDIMGVASSMKRKVILVSTESHPLISPSFMMWDVFTFAYKMDTLKKVFDLDKEQEVKATITTSLTQDPTPRPTEIDIPTNNNIPSVSSCRGQPSIRVDSVEVKIRLRLLQPIIRGIKIRIRALLKRKVLKSGPSCPGVILLDFL